MIDKLIALVKICITILVARLFVHILAYNATIHTTRGWVLHTIPAVNYTVVLASISTIVIASSSVVFIQTLWQHEQVAVRVCRHHTIVTTLTIRNCCPNEIVTAQVCASDNGIVYGKQTVIL